MIARYIIFALVLFILLRVIGRLINTIIPQKKIRRILLRIFPLLEFILWVTFGLWALNGTLNEYPFNNLIITALVAILIAIVSWYFLRDFISGVIIKAEIPFEKNQYIKLPHAEGILKKIGYRSLELETYSGERVKVPFSRFTSDAISVQNPNDGLKGHETLLTITARIPIEELKRKIAHEILLLPWSSINMDPSVTVIEQNADYNTFQVRYFTVSSHNASLISQHLKNVFEKTNTSSNIK
jgi:small-conductance mechanosensitive channel